MSRPTRACLRRVVELACRAPSVHNTQPWLWRIRGGATLDLYADRTRQLPVADPDGRNLMLSCGAALQHAIECARALGLLPVLELATNASDPDHLARIRLSAGRPPTDAVKRLETMEQRCTDRRRFTAWPIPDSRLTQLADAASGWGARAVPLTDVTARSRVEMLLDQAITRQAADQRFAQEQTSWVEHSPIDGIPTSTAVPPTSGRRVARPNRFGDLVEPVFDSRLVESSDGLMAICTPYDDQASWLQAGQTLSALWLHATSGGLSVVPLSQATEVPETRQALHRDVFGSLAHPQLLLRIGWQEIARTTLPRTPRRPLEDVLMA